MKVAYLIDTVEPLDGSKENPIRQELVGCKCAVLSAKVGESAWLAVDLAKDPLHLHRICTSKTVDVYTYTDIISGEIDEYVITTHNSIYRIVRLPEYAHEERDTAFDPEHWHPFQ